jgi:hypothetical protein
VAGRRIEASVVAGQLVVVVPRDAVVDLVTRIGLGNVSYPELTGVNPGHFVSLPPTMTASAAATAPHVTIVAAVGIGHIRIQRATTAVIITPGSRGVNAG